MVEQVESRGPKIQSEPLGQFEGLRKRAIELIVARAARDEATEVTPCAFRRKSKCCRIEPVGNSLIRWVERHAGNQVRTLSGSVSIGQIRCLSGHGDIDRQARSSERNAA